MQPAGDPACLKDHRTPGYISRVIIALGEHAELETQAIIANRRGFIDRTAMREFDDLSASVGQLAHGLLRSLEPQETT
jgi:four helix bundle protein